jgi:hypothetical protein
MDNVGLELTVQAVESSDKLKFVKGIVASSLLGN